MGFLAGLALVWADLLASYVMWIMQTYLTNVWQLGFVHAAGIMNIANGLPKALPFLFYCFVDPGLANKWMLLLSSFSYVIGLGLLSMSTPPVLAQASGTCKTYEPQCVGHIQKTLFYIALALIAVGISGHIVSFSAVFADYLKNEPKEEKPLDSEQTISGILSVRKQLEINRTNPNISKKSHSVRKQLEINQTNPNIPNTSHSVNVELDTKDYKQEVPSQSERTQILIKEIQKRNWGVSVSLPDYRFPPLPPLPDSLSRNQKIENRFNTEDRLEIQGRQNLLKTNQEIKPEDSNGVVLFNLQFTAVDELEALGARTNKVFRYCLIVITPVVAVFSLPYIKPWSLRFGIPAFCYLVATLGFLRGFLGYKVEKRSKTGPVTNIYKVTLAAFAKMFKKLPSYSSELYENDRSESQKLPHTDRLRFLDKAAIQVGPQEKFMLCTVTEVEETKIIFHMFPIWISLIFCGVIASLGNTYFLEQANHMNYMLGKLKLPDSLLLILYASSKITTAGLHRQIRSCFGKKYTSRNGIALATITATLCCIVAALVESRRRVVIRDHGLTDKPDERIPMTVFWLLPQYFLLGAMDSFYENSATHFLSDQSPPSMQKYLVSLSPVLSGIGIVGSFSLVSVVGRVSTRHGDLNWFQHDLNASRLDRYYWTLAGLSAVNFLWFIVYACIYPYRYKSALDVAASDTEAPVGEALDVAASDTEAPVGEASDVDSIESNY